MCCARVAQAAVNTAPLLGAVKHLSLDRAVPQVLPAALKDVFWGCAAAASEQERVCTEEKHMN